jgi:hypothetical protein
MIRPIKRKSSLKIHPGSPLLAVILPEKMYLTTIVASSSFKINKKMLFTPFPITTMKKRKRSKSDQFPMIIYLF